MSNIRTKAQLVRQTVESVSPWQSPVVSRTTNAPPTATGSGARYLLDGGSPSGVWAGHGKSIAEDTAAGVWTYTLPRAGMLVYVSSTDKLWRYDGSVWALFSSISTALSAPTNFTDATLVAGVLTIAHGLGRPVDVTIWDMNGVRVFPTPVPFDSDMIEVDLSAFQNDASYSSGGVLNGTWAYRVT